MKSRNIRNVSLILIVLVIALLMGCPPALEITPITAIAITGDEVVGETLDATSTPASATGTYQWTRADAADGSYTPIAGATGSTYDLVAADAGKYLKVTITGTNAYSGMITSAATSQIANANQLAPIGLAGEAPTSFGGSDGKITGTTAAMEYKLSTDTDYTDASEGETTDLSAGEYDVRYAVKTGYNAGDAASIDVPAFERIPITAIGAISGTAMVGEELTAGTLTPSGATADYQWTICDTEGGSYADIGGATASTYTLVVADEGKFIKVVATGTGNYSGTATSAATVAVAEKVYVAGDTGPAGGLVFYDKGSVSDGWRYLEAAPTDIAVSGTYIFGYSRTDSTSSATTVLIGATATAIGTGQANTTALVNAMGSNAYEVLFAFQSTSTTANYAARLCDIHVVGTFEDWFLPSIDELNSMYTNLKSNGLGDFTTTGFYWSSSEFAAGSASVKLFNVNGTQQNNDKSSPGHVRPIRSF
ncbi:MAG: hypothetical protein CVV52_07635 [Spirochaetae bacterium HGW-Spirochaetae-8]|nr:MAG: hypothetical protein CVV52_07635 [Spirochaetae bacterium HGW-Spirochaetae-8]